ncbi:MAG: hypothetical protein KIT22_16480, partial [Verrucomicrobiae bacterium]|nr:hypothetical protein [Verrucomicrobiae bacterium]
DRTNRIHLLLPPAYAESNARMQISFEFSGGGQSSNSVSLPGFADHEVVVQWRNGAGNTVLVYSNLFNARANILLERTVAALGATPGPNTLELIRTGPNLSPIIQWILFDFVRIEALGTGGSAAPLLAGPSADSAVTGARLSAARADLGPDGTLEFSYLQSNSPSSGWRQVLESSEDLVLWTPVPAFHVRSSAAEGGKAMTVRVASTAEDTPRRFFRVRMIPESATSPATK